MISGMAGWQERRASQETPDEQGAVAKWSFGGNFENPLDDLAGPYPACLDILQRSHQRGRPAQRVPPPAAPP